MCLGCCRTYRVNAMKKFTNFTIGLTLIGGVLFGIGFAFFRLTGWVIDLEQQQTLTIVAMSGLVFSPVISYLTTRAIETRKLTHQAAIERKIEIYEKLVDLMVDMTGLRSTNPLEGDELFRRIQELTPKALIYTSNGFMKEWRKMSSVSEELVKGGISQAQMMDQFESVFKAIRKDVGHNRWTTKRGDIWSLLVPGGGDVVE